MKSVQNFHEENESKICGKQLIHIFLHQFQNLLSIHQYQTFHKIQVEEVHEVGVLNEVQIPCQLQFQISDV